MEYQLYYKDRFRKQLQDYINDIPEEKRYHQADYHGKGYLTHVIQYIDLKRESGHIRLIPENDHVNFALALFHTVFVDQFFYTYYKDSYTEFRRITLYPKIIGDCPGGCYYNLSPKMCFQALLTQEEAKKVKELFPGSLVATKDEIVEFLQNYMPQIDSRMFWVYYRVELNELSLLS